MTDNGAHRTILGTPHKIQRRRRIGQIHQQNKRRQDQYLPLQHRIDPISVTTHTNQRMSSQKINNLTRILTNLLVLEMQHLV
jgi:hypothetical protein